MIVERRWLSIAETAARLGLSVKGCYRLAATGRLPCGRIGRSLRVDWPALEEKLEAEARSGERGIR